MSNNSIWRVAELAKLENLDSNTLAKQIIKDYCLLAKVLTELNDNCCGSLMANKETIKEETIIQLASIRELASKQ